MSGSVVCLAAVLLGVDARWPPLPDGGLQYVIQIEPHALDRRESGANEAVRSYVPPYVKDVRAYQIVMGTQRLAKNVRTANVQSLIRTGVDTDWIRLPAGGVECRVWIHPQVLAEFEKPGRVIEGKIPAGIKKLSVFTISVGTKPPAAGSPATDQTILPGPAEAKADQLPARPPPRPLVTLPHVAERPDSGPPLPGVGPLTSRVPDTPAAPTVTDVAPSPPAAGVTPPDLPSEPPAFEPDPDSRQIPTQPASHLERPESTPDARPGPKADASSIAKKESPAGGPAKPQWPPTLTLLGLFASLAGNVFLLWIMRDFRSRYRALLRRMGEVGDIVRSCVLEIESSG